MEGGVRIRIRPDGTVQAETLGVTGDACLAWVPLVEEVTGAVTVGSEYLPAFFAVEEQADAVEEQDQRW